MGNAIIKAGYPNDAGFIMVSGNVAYLRLGSRKRFKVLLQDMPEYLLDYRTGQCFPSVLASGMATLQHEAIYIMATLSPSHARFPRACAQMRLDMLVDKLGEEHIFKTLDRTPTLNED